MDQNDPWPGGRDREEDEAVFDGPGRREMVFDRAADAEDVQESGISSAIEVPELQLENIHLPMMIESAKAEGVSRYAFRTGFAVSWSTHFDVAETVERLFLDKTFTGTAGVGQLPGLTGANNLGCRNRSMRWPFAP